MKIKYIKALLMVIISVCDDDEEQPLWKRERLSAVVSYNGIDDLFMELRHRKMSAENPSGVEDMRSEGVCNMDKMPDSLNVKKRICKTILNSSHFKEKLYYFVNPQSRSVRPELKRQRATYEDLFKQVKKKHWFPGVGDRLKYVYQNPFKERKISVYGRTIKVFAFSCLVKKDARYNFEQFYVSEEYNMSLASYKSVHARPIAGRFVFGSDHQNGLEVTAVAQESSKSLGQKHRTFVEFFFLDKKLSHSIADKSDADPICKLSLGQRMRLCASIFSMPHFKRRPTIRPYKFIPSTLSVQGDCEKYTVAFRSREVRRQAGKKVFQEYMIPCRPRQKRGERYELIPFFISRAYVDDKVFLLRNRRGKMYLELYIYNTGIVDSEEKGKKGKA